jgi:hypothetical protein
VAPGAPCKGPTKDRSGGNPVATRQLCSRTATEKLLLNQAVEAISPWVGESRFVKKFPQLRRFPAKNVRVSLVCLPGGCVVASVTYNAYQITCGRRAVSPRRHRSLSRIKYIVSLAPWHVVKRQQNRLIPASASRIYARYPLRFPGYNTSYRREENCWLQLFEIMYIIQHLTTAGSE